MLKINFAGQKVIHWDLVETNGVWISIKDFYCIAFPANVLADGELFKGFVIRWVYRIYVAEKFENSYIIEFTYLIAEGSFEECNPYEFYHRIFLATFDLFVKEYRKRKNKDGYSEFLRLPLQDIEVSNQVHKYLCEKFR